jgi:hypothetical protein
VSNSNWHIHVYPLITLQIYLISLGHASCCRVSSLFLSTKEAPMKAYQRMIATALLGYAALVAGGNVYAGDDLEICQGGYKELLMTPGECRSYLIKLKAAQARADHLAILDLQEWHTELLIERSQACPCQTEPAVMHRVSTMGNSRPQYAYLSKH